MNAAMPKAGGGPTAVDVQWTSVPRDGEHVNGDGVLVRHDGDRVLIAVIDSLGHGPKANEVTNIALDHLGSTSLERGVAGVMDSLHVALRNTRGSAALLLIAKGDTVECSGVGNVEMRAHRSNIPLVLSAGVLGVRLRQARVATGKVSRPDRIVIFSDGISRRFDFHDVAGLSPKDASAKIFASCRRAHDDATILVADFP
jgi:negative regulator of sigma-B (phosphoserine phosphatase)